MPTLHRYDRQARTYDRTRHASPSIAEPLAAALAGAPGTALLDVGGGTGNYALALRERGWAVVVADLDEAMLAHAAAKGLPTVRADAAALPVADASWDAVMLVSMIHHVPDQAAALHEAARALRPGGRLAVMLWVREHMDEIAWVVDYFPSTRAWTTDIHLPAADYLAMLPGAELAPLELRDLDDACLSALQRCPELLLDPEVRRQTSYIERLADTNPDELAAGTERLRRDLAAGRRPEREVEAARARWGDASILRWVKPA